MPTSPSPELPQPFSADLVRRSEPGPQSVLEPDGQKRSAARRGQKAVRAADGHSLSRPSRRDDPQLLLSEPSLARPMETCTEFWANAPIGPGGTNYGINYVPASDVFQVYVNDVRGFHIANYSARKVIGTRRLVHLTATSGGRRCSASRCRHRPRRPARAALCQRRAGAAKIGHGRIDPRLRRLAHEPQRRRPAQRCPLDVGKQHSQNRVHQRR